MGRGICPGIFYRYYLPILRDKAYVEFILLASNCRCIKANTRSFIFWQIGMYGWMAICNFLIFGHTLNASMPVFWMMMQVGMLFGLLTAYPINLWLIRKGFKETL